MVSSGEYFIQKIEMTKWDKTAAPLCPSRLWQGLAAERMPPWQQATRHLGLSGQRGRSYDVASSGRWLSAGPAA